ncbi:uncharacterized protein LOC113348513 isoform X1 [Papaver somniferum]|uniref:uncharacterized protein LOC113348513 isoform X1 n=2 Tax=Papaver somniferum TaxID=3469 RepID=UPI000E6FD1C8|nr:uncharacterized protein LOC113348513 isoform X1 [Papaver somniferum]
MDLVGGGEAVDPSKVVGSEENLVSVVGEKRVVVDCDETENFGVKKKARVDYGGDMKRVAELVLVLSGMGKMRGGRNPTDVEKELMVEAKEKLVEICQFMSPQDVIPKDAIRVVMEDLGLNKSADQRLGFRPSKMSIAEKYVLAKKKMEESQKLVDQSGTFSSPMLKAGYGTKADINRTMHTLHTVHKSPALGGYQAATSVVHVPSVTSPASLNQLHVNGVQSASVSRGSIGTSSGPVSSSSHLHRNGPPIRSDGRPNGSIYPSHVQANASGNHATFSPQSVAVNKVGQGNKGLDHTRNVDGTTEASTYKVALQVTRDQNSKPSVQTVHGNAIMHQPSQVTNYHQPSSVFSNHSDIAKNVQKLLHSRPPQHPNWTPPSTDYMNKSLTCQICKVTIIDVESLLVCDACEHGVHLKCLQSFNQKGIPKGEWHCPKCLISSNGKPLPPKYGRVTRNNPTQKVSSNTTKTQAPPVKVERQNEKVDPQKITANGNPDGQYLTHVGSTGGTHPVSASDSQASNASEDIGTKLSSCTKKIDEEPLPEMKSVPKEATGVCSPANSNKSKDSSTQQHQNSDSSSCQQEALTSEVKSLPNVQSGVSCPDKPSNASIDVSYQSQATCSSQDADIAEQPSNMEVSANPGHTVNTSDLIETFKCNPPSDVRQDGGDVAQIISPGTSDVGNGAKSCLRSSLDGTLSVEWVGDILHVVDEKAFYTSCLINGIVYKLQDHALFRSNNDNLRPSKLQSLWEDTKTGSKWAVVNRCYLPDDLPDVVGLPCTPEINEVYESNHGSTVRAGLIQGPCEVLFPNKFKKISERRSHSETDDGSQPIFSCKWFYDESKGLFRAVTDLI